MPENDQTPSLTLHYLGFAIKPEEIEGPVGPTVYPRYKDYDPGTKIDTSEDEGHTGTDTLVLSNDRDSAECNPTFEDKIRFKEGFEDWLYLLAGSYDEPVPAIVGATIAKRYKFYLDALNPITQLPRATIFQGYNWESAKAEMYDNVVLNSMKFTLDRGEAPKFEIDTVSDYAKYNQNEPTRVFATTDYKLKGSQGKIYMGDVGDSIASMKAAGALDYTKCGLELKNNVEASDSGEFGKPKKDKKPFDGKLDITADYGLRLMNLEAEYATGSESGTDVTEESLFKQFYIEYIGKKIETVAGAPATDVFASMAVLLPKVDLTDVSSPRSGSDAKTVKIEGSILNNGLTNPYEFDVVSPLSALHFGTALS